MKRIICKKKLRAFSIINLSIFPYCQNRFSFSVVRSLPHENSTKEKNADFIKPLVFVNLIATKFAAATGKETSFFQKKYFKKMQCFKKRDLMLNPDLSINKYYDPKKRNSNPVLYGLLQLRL
jgi:hypothetical protein